MLIKSFGAGPWQTNCYVIAPSANSECIIIDPGLGSAPGIKEIIAEHNLKPIATMLTHGHIDHMWSIFPVATGYGIPAYIHGSDRFLLNDPGAGVSVETKNALMEMMASDDVFAEPEDTREVTDQMTMELAGLKFTVLHAPGHTQGSILFDFDGDVNHVFTGDVLFAGAIGRTDLPGSSPADMDTSLRDVVLNLPDSSLVFPGHGPASNMTVEKSSNEYLLRVTKGLSAI
jgi:glyoxylase-like metal-dependent hydrolase (beta-lactamase superfamily II)